MSTDPPSATVPDKIAQKAEEIYERQFKNDVENDHDQGFVAIDVLAERYYFSETAEGALQKARDSAPHGVFHLIQIGAPEAASFYGWGGDESANSWVL